MKTISFILLFLFISIRVYSQMLTPNQKKLVSYTIGAYKSNLAAYSNISSKDTSSLAKRIRYLFQKPFNDDNNHVIDFGDLTSDGLEVAGVNTYLTRITDSCSNKLIINFVRGKTLDYVELDSAGNKFALYDLFKTLSYKNKVYQYHEIIMVNLPGDIPDKKRDYKIEGVYSSQSFSTARESFIKKSANHIDAQNEDLEKIRIKFEADSLFTNATQYKLAIEKYMFLANRYPRDGYLREKIDSCVKKLDESFFISQGDTLMNQRKYADAVNWYKWELKIFPLYKNRSDVEYKIKNAISLSADITYIADVTKAKTAYSKKDFSSAGYFLEDALQYKPNDYSAKILLDSVKLYNGTQAIKEINDCQQLYDKDDQKYAATYYKALKKWEEVTQLSTYQYIVLISILMTNRNFITKELKLSDNERKADLKMYCKKLSDMVPDEINKSYRETAANLLNNVVPNSYQN